MFFGVKSMRNTLILFLLSFSILSCAHATEDEKMLQLGSALTKLSLAVEDFIHFEDVPADMTDTDILSRATDHDPRLLTPFNDVKLRVKSDMKHAIILVCTKDETQALLEDAGCSAPLDAHLWESPSPLACEFTLSAAEACPK
jgi:hypothetical protein